MVKIGTEMTLDTSKKDGSKVEAGAIRRSGAVRVTSYLLLAI